MTPPIGSSELYRVIIPLPLDFQFVHEPLDESTRSRFVGRQSELTTLVDRMVHSRGGAILITGYRGVGKTSFVNQALASFEQRCPGGRVLPVHLNLARPLMPLDLMFLVLRCIYMELHQSSLSDEIAPEVLAALVFAYNRTMMTVKETRSAVADLSLNLPEVTGTTAGVNIKASSLGSYKRSRSRGDESTYLTYDERSAEYDLIRIARRLRGGWTGKPAWWQRALRRPGKPKGDLRIIFVFDEMDKIEDPAVLEDLFSMLKNVFTTSGLTFIFVAGKDIQERWGADVRRGESVYESVFAHEVYLPCLWTEARSCCIGPSPEAPSPEAETIWSAISFQGRGIPRRILRSFHSMVRFENDRPLLAVTPYEYRDAEFYAGIEAILESFRERPSDLSNGDKRSLGLYYLVDWIFNRGTREFTFADAVAAYEALNNKLVITETMAAPIEAVIGALQSRGYIEKAGRVDEKQFLKIEGDAVPRYRVARSNLPENEGGKSPDGQKEVRFGPYLALAPISSGGVGRVIRALDTRSSEVVALKYVRDPSREVRSVFVRESEVLSEVSHPSIPRFRGSEVEGDTVWIAMEFVDASSLHRILQNSGRLPEEAIVYAITAIASICGWLHSSGFVYGDLKPSNLLVTRSGEVKLIDFSTARRIDALPAAFGVFGTPAYMAPELLEGEPNSIKGDIYALGVLAYELLCGRTPFLTTDNYEQLIARIKSKAFRAPSAFMDISQNLEHLILRCMDPNPGKRFADMPEVLAVLSSLTGSQEALAKEIGGRGAPVAEIGSEGKITSIPYAAAPSSLVPVPFPAATQSSVENPTVIPALPRTAIESASLRVIPLDTELSAQVFPIRGSSTRIGRSFESEICVDNNDFSRTHAVITLEEGDYWLRDAGSLNGTSVNGRRLANREPVPLADKDRIGIGKFVFIFEVHRSTSQEASAA